MRLWFVTVYTFDGSSENMMLAAKTMEDAKKCGSDSVDGECYSVSATEIKEVNGYKVELIKS